MWGTQVTIKVNSWQVRCWLLCFENMILILLQFHIIFHSISCSYPCCKNDATLNPISILIKVTNINCVEHHRATLVGYVQGSFLFASLASYYLGWIIKILFQKNLIMDGLFSKIQPDSIKTLVNLVLVGFWKCWSGTPLVHTCNCLSTSTYWWVLEFAIKIW